ncbi:PKD domain-containing protein [Dysgonomonas sp. 25]|uniref:PKD domain-containing protein n=1 Tax=Dysgonomonas sp. 25 TaxID=2302933 RepID=UPI0013D59C46|nr:PKD domain-containing protein [Dysgonomonas sp. 25]NDV70030.1 PKD domain-containing protein [Dysgonomonas sp. 25]
MRKLYLLLITLTTLLLLHACYKESRLLVNADFQATITEENYTAPVKVTFENNTTGADFYKWTFEGGSPTESTEKTPTSVTYNQAGTYTIKLEAWNNHERGEKEFTFSVDSAVNIVFDAEILVNDFAPATVKIINNTEGASTFSWTFEGGNPATSDEQYPGNILFSEAGEHTIKLQVGNGRETFELTKTITLDNPIAVDFDIEPSFDDFDYEAPFIANLKNRTTSGLTYQWTASGGTIADAVAENTTITIQNPGTYTITLQGNNEKEAKTASKDITIKANTNLYTMKDVKFGIKSAASTIGSFYSLKSREIIRQSDVTAENGAGINILFYGINQSFEKCYFTSPDLATNAGFYAIPNATRTYFINTLESTAVTFSPNTFDTMTNDMPLRSIDIKAAAGTTTWFIANPVPRIVLFETADGRKGAIKIKAFVSEQGESYILTDIKFQKQKVN